MRSFLQVFFLLFCFCGGSFSGALAASGPDSHSLFSYEDFTLENGLRVVLVPDHRAPVVTHSVWYRVGGMDETKGKTGLAHMLEHMMFKGTHTIAPGEFSKIIARNGGRDNAFTSKDATAYHQKIGAERLEMVVRMEADRLANLNIDEKNFQTERDVVLEERRLRVDNTPKARFMEELTIKHYGGHPYAAPLIGYAENIQNLTLEDVQNWHTCYYHPNKATMVVVGDVTLETLRPLVEKYFGPIPSAPFEKEADCLPHMGDIEPFEGPKRYEKQDEAVTVPLFVRHYRAPAVFRPVGSVFAMYDLDTHGHLKHVYSLSLLGDILAGGSTSRLYNLFVKEKQIATSVGFRYGPVSRAEEVFTFYIQPKDGISLDTIEKELDIFLSDPKNHVMTQDELDRSRTSFLSTAIYSRDDTFYTMYSLGNWLMAGGSPGTYTQWQEIMKTLTPDNLQTAAAMYLKPENSTTGWLQGGLGE